MSSKTLVLVRHSKASHDALSDISRPLTDKGHGMAEKLAKEISRRLGGLDALLVSPAARARETAQPLSQRMKPADVRVEEGIYTSGPQGILDLVLALDESVNSAVVVGHEPTISYLAHALHNTGDEMAAKISFGVPTATAVFLEIPTKWADVDYQSAHISEIVTIPR